MRNKSYNCNSNHITISFVTIATLIASTLPLSLSARSLSPAEALGMAQHSIDRQAAFAGNGSFNVLNTMSSTSSAPKLVYTEKTDGRSTVYVYNRPTGGFLVVAADDAAGVPLLGYTTEGSFDAASAPENIMGWISGYGEQIAYAADNVETINSAYDDLESLVDHKAVAPIVKTLWGQTAPYNTLTPEVSGAHSPVGCVATAMAQVMSVYRYPSCGTGSVSYRSSSLGLTMEYDFTAHPIDWDKIDNRYSSTSTGERAEAIAELMYTCGMATKMNYGRSASSANYVNAFKGLFTYLGYDAGMSYLQRQYYTEAEWDNLVYAELEAGRPVLYSGTSKTEGGHAFVCDGYSSDSYYHINWGWDGYLNGYFRLSALDCRKNGNGFNNNSTMIIGIKPAEEGSTTNPVFTANGSIFIDRPAISRRNGVLLTIDHTTGGIWHYAVAKSYGTFGVELTNIETGEVHDVFSTTASNLLSGQCVRKFVVHSSKMPDHGVWRMSSVYLPEDAATPHKVSYLPTIESAYILTCTSDSVHFETESAYLARKAAEESILKVTEYNAPEMVSDTELLVPMTLVNTTATTQEVELTARLMMGDDEMYASEAVMFAIGAREEETMELSFNFENAPESGNYVVEITDAAGHIVGERMTLTVEHNDNIQAAIGDLPTDDMEVAMIEVYEISGRLALRAASTDEMNSLPAGLYIVRTTYTSGHMTSKKTLIR